MNRSSVQLQALALSLMAGLGLAGCGRHEKPNFTYMPDMVYSPAYKAQKEGAMRVPPKGTIPRDYVPYSAPVGMNEVDAGKLIANPMKRTKEVLARGQNQYNIYCIVCHGPAGEGDGTVVPKFPRPPSLQSEKVRTYTDGAIFHLISRGRNLMPSYASQIAPEDRWSIIHYIRALQRSKHPTPEDLKAAAE